MEANTFDSSITNEDIARLTAKLESAFREASSENDGDWRQVSGNVPGTFSGGHTPFLFNWSALLDRDDGRFVPFYQYETDLRSIRAKSRNLATFTSIAVGAMKALGAYTVGGQWQYEVETREGVNESGLTRRLCDAVQKVVDELLERNDFCGSLDLAIHDAAREDGEALVGVYASREGAPKVRLIDPECLREPHNKNQIEVGLQRLGYPLLGPQSWSFGVHTGYDDIMRRIDHSTPIGYHLVYDESGSEWDYLPAFPWSHAGRLSGKCLVHLKLNVPPSAKRGVSDFYPIQELLERKFILGRNLAVGTAIQAAIAYIRHHTGSVTRDQVVSRISAALDNISRQATSTRTDGKTQQNFTPGTVIDTTTEYHAGPLGENRSPIFIEVASYLMRCCGIRWMMPEYMISGDASNANFASTLVAESPFVRARESDQRPITTTFRKICWAAVKIAYDRGELSPFVGSWQQLRQLVDISVKPPVVASRDRAQTLAEATTLYSERLISANDVLVDLNREPKPEFDDKYADPEPTPVVVAPHPAAVGGVHVGQVGGDHPGANVAGNKSVVAAKESAIAAALESVKTTNEARLILESIAGGGDPDGHWVTISGRHVFIKNGSEAEPNEDELRTRKYEINSHIGHIVAFSGAGGHVGIDPALKDKYDELSKHSEEIRKTLHNKYDKPRQEKKAAEEKASRERFWDAEARRLAEMPTYQTKNGWEILKDGAEYHVRDPYTKETIYRGKLSRAREVANESPPDKPSENAA